MPSRLMRDRVMQDYLEQSIADMAQVSDRRHEEEFDSRDGRGGVEGHAREIGRVPQDRRPEKHPRAGDSGQVQHLAGSKPGPLPSLESELEFRRLSLQGPVAPDEPDGEAKRRKQPPRVWPCEKAVPVGFEPRNAGRRTPRSNPDKGPKPQQARQSGETGTQELDSDEGRRGVEGTRHGSGPSHPERYRPKVEAGIKPGRLSSSESELDGPTVGAGGDRASGVLTKGESSTGDVDCVKPDVAPGASGKAPGAFPLRGGES